MCQKHAPPPGPHLEQSIVLIIFGSSNNLLPLKAWRYGALFSSIKLFSMKPLHSNSSKHIIKIPLDTIATKYSYCKRSVGACRGDGRVPTAGSPTLAGERSHLNFCIKLLLSSSKLLMSTHLFLYMCYSHPSHISLTVCHIQTYFDVSHHLYKHILHKTLY